MHACSRSKLLHFSKLVHHIKHNSYIFQLQIINFMVLGYSTSLAQKLTTSQNPESAKSNTCYETYF